MHPTMAGPLAPTRMYTLLAPDGGGAVGQAAPIPTETPTMSFDWAAPQQPEQQQAYGAPAAIGASFA